MKPPNPSGRCMCGCGEPAPIAARTVPKFGHVKGQATKYVHGHVNRLPPPARDPVTGCLIWQGKPGPDGRPRRNRYGLPYRRAYERARGPIPPGHHLHHTCGIPMCVNPDHLEPMLPSEHSLLHASER